MCLLCRSLAPAPSPPLPSTQTRVRKDRVRRVPSLADNLGLRYCRVANLVHPRLAVDPTMPAKRRRWWQSGKVHPTGGALSTRYLEQVTSMKIDESVMSASAHAQLKEEFLFGCDDAATRAREHLEANQKPEAPPCQCFSYGQSGVFFYCRYM